MLTFLSYYITCLRLLLVGIESANIKNNYIKDICDRGSCVKDTYDGSFYARILVLRILILRVFMILVLEMLV